VPFVHAPYGAPPALPKRKICQSGPRQQRQIPDLAATGGTGSEIAKFPSLTCGSLQNRAIFHPCHGRAGNRGISA